MDDIRTMIISLIIAVTLGAFGLSQAMKPVPGGTNLAVNEFRSAMREARALARTTGDGATLVLTKQGKNETFQVYRHRPFASLQYPIAATQAVQMKQVRVALGGVYGSQAIAFNSVGAASVVAWTPGAAAIAAETPCTTLSVEVDNYGNEVAAGGKSLDCVSGELGP